MYLCHTQCIILYQIIIVCAKFWMAQFSTALQWHLQHKSHEIHENPYGFPITTLHHSLQIAVCRLHHDPPSHWEEPWDFHGPPLKLEEESPALTVARRRGEAPRPFGGSNQTCDFFLNVSVIFLEFDIVWSCCTELNSLIICNHLDPF